MLLCSPASICQEQLRGLFAELNGLVSAAGGALCDVCYIHLYLSDMALFPHMNEEYKKWFGINPPSRSCVAVRFCF